IIIFWCISKRNRFAHLAIKIIEADSGIDVALTKRYDTLTKMLDVTKGYAKHEAEVLESIVKLRTGMSIAERGTANRQMDELEAKLSILAEGYPTLKANENFKQLQYAISEAEDHLQAARRIYNMNVSAFNQLLASWPASIIGSAMAHSPKDFFEADEHKKQDVKMDF
ncbi:LemA family protein, partial [Clostridia bacterium OttesenSCG-928-F22]|nr:LemA family protein [Clostridia bacterium OttesenSCG-928-F22]